MHTGHNNFPLIFFVLVYTKNQTRQMRLANGSKGTMSAFVNHSLRAIDPNVSFDPGRSNVSKDSRTKSIWHNRVKSTSAGNAGRYDVANGTAREPMSEVPP